MNVRQFTGGIFNDEYSFHVLFSSNDCRVSTTVLVYVDFFKAGHFGQEKTQSPSPRQEKFSQPVRFFPDPVIPINNEPSLIRDPALLSSHPLFSGQLPDSGGKESQQIICNSCITLNGKRGPLLRSASPWKRGMRREEQKK